MCKITRPEMAERSRLEAMVGRLDTPPQVDKLMHYLEKHFPLALIEDKKLKSVSFEYTKLGKEDLGAINEFLKAMLN